MRNAVKDIALCMRSKATFAHDLDHLADLNNDWRDMIGALYRLNYLDYDEYDYLTSERYGAIEGAEWALKNC